MTNQSAAWLITRGFSPSAVPAGDTSASGPAIPGLDGHAAVAA